MENLELEKQCYLGLLQNNLILILLQFQVLNLINYL